MNRAVRARMQRRERALPTDGLLAVADLLEEAAQRLCALAIRTEPEVVGAADGAEVADAEPEPVLLPPQAAVAAGAAAKRVGVDRLQRARTAGVYAGEVFHGERRRLPPGPPPRLRLDPRRRGSHIVGFPRRQLPHFQAVR